VFAFVEPLVALGPGATAAVGLFHGARVTVLYGKTRNRALRAERFLNVLRGDGFDKLAEELERTLNLHRTSQVKLNDFVDQLDVIADRYRQGER
jgi:hypothetical protein